jgi:hypothetical protein
MSQKLVLVRGGKVERTGGGKKRKKASRLNPLNDLLWRVTSKIFYTQRASSIEEVAQRMTRMSKKVLGYQVNVSRSAADHCILDCRRRKRTYGWFPMHVQKGAFGLQRGLVPMLVDVDDESYERFLLDEEDMVFIYAGFKSSLLTISSMLANDADGTAFMIGLCEAMGNPIDDIVKEFAEDIRFIARKAAKAAATAVGF